MKHRIVLLVAGAVLASACSSPRTIAMLPQQINGADVEYREAYFEGPAHAGAVWDDGVPVVYFEDVSNLDPVVQWFIKLHELCHLRGAHYELGADCCAGATFNKFKIPMADAALWLLRNSYTDAEHPPGAARSLRFATCNLTGDDGIE